MTFAPSRSGLLRVMHGGIWLTFGPLRRESLLDLRKPDHAQNILKYGDHFLSAGDTLPLAFGDAVVVEFWQASCESGAVFQFEPGIARSA